METEAENVRSSILNAVQHVKSFGEEVSESARRLAGVIQQIEGGIQVIPNTDGVPTAQQVEFFCFVFFKFYWSVCVCVCISVHEKKIDQETEVEHILLTF